MLPSATRRAWLGTPASTAVSSSPSSRPASTAGRSARRPTRAARTCGISGPQIEAVAAGFRACRRCRPEAAPGTPRWNGTASTVSRALRLIEEGALREHGLSELSRRLGVSARQLHRLFSLHLGTSPTAVAKSWRLSFATRLLRETDLPMGRVALESGFRTVRRFNDEIRATYGRTPPTSAAIRTRATRSATATSSVFPTARRTTGMPCSNFSRSARSRASRR